MVLGDGEGWVSIVDRHGIVVEKVKVMESVRGMVLRGRCLVVYGTRVAKCMVS